MSWWTFCWWQDKLIPMYAGEAGADDEHDRSIADRLRKHIRVWLADYTEYWTGVKRSDLELGKMKFHLHIVGEAEKLETRKKVETYTVLRERPYLQYGPYQKYFSKYDGVDLCIIPWKDTRRKAFLDRLEQEGITVKESTSLIARILDKDFKPDWEKRAKSGKEKEPVLFYIHGDLNYFLVTKVAIDHELMGRPILGSED